MRPNVLGVAFVLMLAALIIAAGVTIGMISAPLSGGTLFGALLITTGGLLVARLLYVTGRERGR